MKFKDRFWWVLRQTDLLRRPYEFKLRWQEKTGTAFGGVLSIFILMAIGAYFFMRFIQLQQKDTYIETAETVFDENDFLDNDSLNFIIQLEKIHQKSPGQNVHSLLSQEQFSKYIDLKFHQVTHNHHNNTIIETEKELKIQTCSQQSLKNMELDQSIGLHQNFNYFMCPNEKFKLQRYFSNINHSYIRISFFPKNVDNCSLVQQSDDCYEKNKEIIEFINTCKITIYIGSTEFSFQGKGLVSKIVPKVHSFRLSNHLGTEQILSMQPQVLQNIKTSILDFVSLKKNIESEMKGQKVYKEQIQYQPLNYQEERIGSIQIKIEPSKQMLRVESTDLFVKLLEALSEVGGLFTSIFFSTSLIYQFYHRHKIYEDLINESFLFDFKNDEEMDKTKSKWFSAGKQSSAYNKKNPLVQIYNYKVKYSFFKYLFTYFAKKCGCKKRISKNQFLFYKAKKKLQQDLDLVHLVKKLYEVDKLKLLLMKNDQLVLFNSLINPLIEVEREKNFINLTGNPSQITNRNRASSAISINSSFNDRGARLKRKMDYNLKSTFFASTVEEMNPQNILQSFQNVRQEANSYNQNSQKNILQKQQSINFNSQVQAGSPSHKKITMNQISKSQIQVETEGFDQIISVKLLNILQRNENVYNMIQFQEKLLQPLIASPIENTAHGQQISSLLKKKKKSLNFSKKGNNLLSPTISNLQRRRGTSINQFSEWDQQQEQQQQLQEYQQQQPDQNNISVPFQNHQRMSYQGRNFQNLNPLIVKHGLRSSPQNSPSNKSGQNNNNIKNFHDVAYSESIKENNQSQNSQKVLQLQRADSPLILLKESKDNKPNQLHLSQSSKSPSVHNNSIQSPQKLQSNNIQSHFFQNIQEQYQKQQQTDKEKCSTFSQDSSSSSSSTNSNLTHLEKSMSMDIDMEDPNQESKRLTDMSERVHYQKIKQQNLGIEQIKSDKFAQYSKMFLENYHQNNWVSDLNEQFQQMPQQNFQFANMLSPKRNEQMYTSQDIHLNSESTLPPKLTSRQNNNNNNSNNQKKKNQKQKEYQIPINKIISNLILMENSGMKLSNNIISLQRGKKYTPVVQGSIEVSSNTNLNKSDPRDNREKTIESQINLLDMNSSQMKNSGQYFFFQSNKMLVSNQINQKKGVKDSKNLDNPTSKYSQQGLPSLKKNHSANPGTSSKIKTQDLRLKIDSLPSSQIQSSSSQSSSSSISQQQQQQSGKIKKKKKRQKDLGSSSGSGILKGTPEMSKEWVE